MPWRVIRRSLSSWDISRPILLSMTSDCVLEIFRRTSVRSSVRSEGSMLIPRRSRRPAPISGSSMSDPGLVSRVRTTSCRRRSIPAMVFGCVLKEALPVTESLVRTCRSMFYSGLETELLSAPNILPIPA